MFQIIFLKIKDYKTFIEQTIDKKLPDITWINNIFGMDINIL